MSRLKKISKEPKLEMGFRFMAFMWIIIVCFFVWLLGISGIISLSWFYTYKEILAWKAEKTPYFQDALLKFDIPLPYKNYFLARGISVLLFLLGIASGMLLLIKRKVFKRWMKQVYGFIIEQLLSSKQAFSSLKVVEKLGFIFILIVSIVLRIYHFSYLPVHIDELTTYYSFVNEGFLLTSLYYPIPNNHVFFNYIFVLSSQFINDPILAARIPSALAFHLLLLILFFGLLRYFKSFIIAFLSSSFCVFFFPSSVYAAEGRGYAVLSLMVILAAFSLLLIIEKDRKEAMLIFIPACIIGAWTVPVFLVPFLSLMCFWLFVSIFRMNKLLFKWMILSGLGIGIGVFISYLPMFLFSGVGAIAANETVVPVEATNFFTYIYPVASAEILSFFAGTDTKGWAIFLAFGILALVIYRQADEKYRRWMQLSFFVIGMIFLYALLARRFMFQRTITYATYFLYPAATVILVYATNRIINARYIRKVVFGALFLIIPFLSYVQYQENVFEVHLLPSEYYNILEQHLEQALQEEDKVYIAASDDYMYIHLYGRYLAEIKHMDLIDSIDKANMLIVEESFLSELTENELVSFQQTGCSPSLAAYLGTLLFYEKE